jgi:hypothetical protein
MGCVVSYHAVILPNQGGIPQILVTPDDHVCQFTGVVDFADFAEDSAHALFAGDLLQGHACGVCDPVVEK